MKKVLAVLQMLVMAVSLGLTAWSLHEAAVQRRAARDAANDLAGVRDAYAAAAARADDLEAQLQALQGGTQAESEPNAEPLPGQYTREEADALAAQYKPNVQEGSSIGRVWVEGTNINCGLYWGDTQAILNLGAGCANYEGNVMPGENGTVFIGGHTGSYFSDLGSAQIGSIIHLETPWGDFRYRVRETRVNEEDDIDAFLWGGSEPVCELYTCYPFGILEHTIYRYTVYADPLAADEQGVLPFDPAVS